MPAHGPAVQPVQLPPAARNERLIAYACLVVSLVVLMFLRGAFIRANSVTLDELTHLQAGYRYWQCGEFANNPEHPPLVKFVAAAPIRHSQIKAFPTPCGAQVIVSRQTDMHIDYTLASLPNQPEMLHKARVALFVFPALLVIAGFFAALEWFGEIAAVIVTLLLTFEPNLLAHGSLVTTDMAFTTFFFVSVWMAISFVLKGTWWRAALLAGALGLALSSKHSAIALPAILLIVMFATKRWSSSANAASYRKIGGAWALACVAAIVILWGMYGFRYYALPGRDSASYDLEASFRAADAGDSLKAVAVEFAAEHHLLPEAYLVGLTDLFTTTTRPAYFFGSTYPTGFWYYFPVALLIKLTLSSMILCALTLALPAIRKAYGSLIFLLSVAPALFLLLSMTSKLNIGVRHVLPVVPFICLIGAAGAAVLLRESRAWNIVAGVLLAFFLISALHAAPRQLSYANEAFGGPNHLYQFLGDSNVDWGQSSAVVEQFIDTQQLAPNCFLASGMPFRAPSQCQELPTYLSSGLWGTLPPPVPEKFTGTLIIQPLAVAWSDAYLPFLRRKPDAILAGGSILVYRGEFDFAELAAMRRLDRGIFKLTSLGDAGGAMQEFKAAEAHITGGNAIALRNFEAAALQRLALK